MLWFIQHALWDQASRPELGRAFHDAWHEGYERVNRTLADAVVAALDDHPEATVFFHDYHLYLAPGFVRGGAPGRAARALRAHPVADATGRCCPSRCAAPCTRACSRTTSSRSTRGGGRGTSSAAARTSSAGRTGRRSRTIRSPSTSASSSGCRRARPSALRRTTLPRPEKLIVRVDRTDPSKNIVRGFHAFALLLDEHPEWRGRVDDARAARSVPAGDPRVRRVRRRDRAGGPRGERPVRAGDRPAGRRRLPAIGRRLQAVRRAARQSGLRRAEPRRQGGPAGQRARRGARALRERRRVRRARRSGRSA